MPDYDSQVVGADEVFFPKADDGSGGSCQGKVPGALAYRVRVRCSSLNSFLIRSKKIESSPSTCCRDLDLELGRRLMGS
jgi:hypothetical protein